MRTLNGMELEHVAGGDWSISFDFKVISGTLSGDEDAGEIFGAIGGAISDAYWTARDATADFYESVGNLFASGCVTGGGGGR